MLNCNQINKLSIYHYLTNNSIQIFKDSENEAWFFSPFRNEKTASFKVNKIKNTFYDFGTGKGGKTVDLIMLLHRCSVKDVLELFKNKDYFFFPKHKHLNIKEESLHTSNQSLIKIKDLTNSALVSYLNHRNINIPIAQTYCKEVYYKNNDKNYFSIGFENLSNGFEMRNQYFKNCLGKKNISLIRNDSEVVSVFEGFIDFLSYRSLKLGENENYLVLNSISLYENSKKYLSEFKHIKLFLDNDNAGNRLTEEILESYPKAKDFSCIYKNNKDFNEYINSPTFKK